MFVLQEKLRHLKGILRKWAQTNYGNGHSLSAMAREKLFSIQNAIQHNPNDIFLQEQEINLKNSLSKALLEENKMAKQKARIN